MIDIQLLHAELHAHVCEEFVRSAETGGVVVFSGVVRNQTGGRKVLRLEFEAYPGMAIREMQQIAQTARERFAVLHVSMHHRTGILYPDELAVVIAVGAAHRDAAFDACRFCIDTLKQTVPIWKKEFYEDGAVWVSAHP